MNMIGIIRSWDIHIMHILSSWRGESLNEVIVFFARYFPYILFVFFVWFAVVEAACLRDKIKIFLEGIIAAGIAKFGIVGLIRYFYHRPRPFVSEQFTALLSENSYSFPSGHAAFFFALSTVVFMYNRRWGIWFYAASLLIGLARVAAGVHYPSDILGGAAVGVIVGLAAVKISRKLSTYKASPPSSS